MIKMGSEREGKKQQEEVLQLEKDVEEENDVKAKEGEVNLVEETIRPMAAPPTMLVVGDTQSDSIQCLNFAQKNDSFNIRLNIALPKIHFKMLFNSKKILLIQFRR